MQQDEARAGYQPMENRGRQSQTPERELLPEEQADEMIHQAEAAKSKIFPPKGDFLNNDFQFIAEMDQDYMVVGSHIDEATRDKIIRG